MTRTATDAPNPMRWVDRVYGPSMVDHAGILNLIATPTFQRLRGIRQAGPSAFAHPFKTVSRFEHSLGVYLLLRRLGAEFVETVAGLVHDISHTAFSHAVDFLYDTEEQAHHESLKPDFLNRPDVRAALQALGLVPDQFYHDAIYTLLERPLPWLCADRLDYFLRDGASCGVVSAELTARVLDALVVVDHNICVNSVDVARDIQARFAEMNRDWWSGPVEAYIYNEFADAMRLGIEAGALAHDDLLQDDEHVLACLRAARKPAIHKKLDNVMRVPKRAVRAYRPRVVPKTRWLDPPVVLEGVVRTLSQIDHPKDRAAKAG